MDLILWRHAEAEYGPPDLQRKLTGKGIRQAQYSAAWLRERLPANYRVLASEARRSQQTAQALTDQFEISAAINPGCDATALLQTCQWPDSNQTLLVVGHQPSLGQAAARLLAGVRQDWSIKKSAVWWFSQRTRDGARQVVLQAVLWPDEA